MDDMITTRNTWVRISHDGKNEDKRKYTMVAGNFLQIKTPAGPMYCGLQ